jgi:hypothetical protein
VVLGGKKTQLLPTELIKLLVFWQLILPYTASPRSTRGFFKRFSVASFGRSASRKKNTRVVLWAHIFEKL